MSWKPKLWIKKEDFKKFENELKVYDVWEFNIAGIDGYILMAGGFTSSHRELHDIIENVPHWILNGEGQQCTACKEWGKQIYEYDEEGYYEAMR